MKKFLIALFVVCLYASSAFGASVITQSLERIPNTSVYVWSLSWTAHTDGTVTATAMSSSILEKVGGYWVAMATTIPGSPAPTDNYDLTITDSDGIDVMGGSLANRSTSTAQQAVPLITTGVYGGRLVTGALTVNWSNNSANGAKGTIRVFLTK